MTTEDLDGIDRALRALSVADVESPRLKDAVSRFNAGVERARSRLAAARVSHERARNVPADVEIELKAYAVMYASERERLVGLWGRPLHRRVAASR